MNLDEEAENLKMAVLCAGYRGFIHWARVAPADWPPICLIELTKGGPSGYIFQTIQALEVGG